MVVCMTSNIPRVFSLEVPTMYGKMVLFLVIFEFDVFIKTAIIIRFFIKFFTVYSKVLNKKKNIKLNC